MRTLLILITLVAAYFGCWEFTRRVGLESVQDVSVATSRDGDFVSFYEFDTSPAPFVIGRYRMQLSSPTGDQHFYEYHVWFFGFTRKIFEHATESPWEEVEWEMEEGLEWDAAETIDAK